MKVVSITGGVGSGKSEVLRVLEEEFGAEVILADLVAHEVMEPGEEGYRRVIGALGDSFLEPDGTVNRKKLAALIFGDEKALETMNSIVHPLTWDRIRDRIQKSERELVVVEAALFDEEHNAMFDEIWYVYTTAENRIKRLMESRGYTRQKCLDIMENQASEEEYRKLADRVIDNNGTVDDICTQLKKILKED